VVDGITHYCVPNLPSLVARSATYALGNITLPFISALASSRAAVVFRRLPTLQRGVNLYEGEITHPRVADAHGREYVELTKLLSA
jgi:alanine dehydrogenase